MFWSQDHLRRAVTAMAECRSNDRFILARACLQAAIRNEADLLDLLPAEPQPPKAALEALLALTEVDWGRRFWFDRFFSFKSRSRRRDLRNSCPSWSDSE